MPAAAAAVVEAVERLGVELLLYVPCSTAAPVLAHFARHPRVETLVVTKEEEGVGIACGLSLAGRRAVLVMQDTGFGNAITALTTFALAYHVPLFILATRTGGAHEINAAVHEYSDRLPAILSAAGIHHEQLDLRVPVERWAARIVELERYSRTSHKPVVVLADLKGRQGS
jgi:sulfopyruvate decarboxylase alpha subunit